MVPLDPLLIGRSTLVLMVALAMLAGCAGTTEKGKSYYVYKNASGNGS